jgi:hypothetical protein
VATALVANATPGVVSPGPGSPNLLLFMGMIPVWTARLTWPPIWAAKLA